MTPHTMNQQKEQAILALHTYSGGLQIGGGVNPENAGEYLDAGASHVIVTSYVFKDGRISWENLNRMKETVGKEKLVLDLSCRRKDEKILYCDRPLAEIYRCHYDTGYYERTGKLLR